MRKEWRWILATMIGALIVTGWPFHFNFFGSMDIHLHDTYIIVRPIYLSFLVWTCMAFFLFGIRAIANRFSDVHGVTVLAVVNGCFILSTLWLSYGFYNFVSSLGQIEINPEMVQRLQIITLITIACIVIIFLILEFFLIRRIKSLNAGIN